MQNKFGPQNFVLTGVSKEPFSFIYFSEKGTAKKFVGIWQFQVFIGSPAGERGSSVCTEV